jgi:hypothetical protein
VTACGELVEPRPVSTHTGAGIGAPRRAVALRARGTQSDTVQKSLAGVVYSVGASFSDSPMCSGVAYTGSVRKRGGESCLSGRWPRWIFSSARGVSSGA